MFRLSVKAIFFFQILIFYENLVQQNLVNSSILGTQTQKQLSCILLLTTVYTVCFTSKCSMKP